MCSFQVAFLDEGMYITPLWIINRFVDVFFSLDIILTFNRAYQESIDNGGHWVFNKWVIARHYVRFHAIRTRGPIGS